jgi:integrase
MALFKRGNTWWYEFIFARRRIRESAKTGSKTVAKQAEQNRRRELEKGFNGLEDNREDRIKSVSEVAKDYLEDYYLRHQSGVFARYAVGNVTRLLGEEMIVDVTAVSVKEYQTARLKEDAAPKTINDEVGFLLRLMGEAGDVVRARLRRQKSLKLPVRTQVGKAFTPEEKEALLAAAKTGRSPAIYPALMLALNAGMRSGEIRGLQWGRMDLDKAVLTVGKSKTEAGEGRTIPLNSTLLATLVEYSKWYERRFGKIQSEWYVFPFGKPRPQDPARPVVSFQTSWDNVRAKAKVKGRWHDTRHTLITDLAESGAADETIREIAGHVSPQMLKHYSHIRMQAKREALQGIVATPPPQHPDNPPSSPSSRVVPITQTVSSPTNARPASAA